ncbi:DUF421 domain-containing protein [Sporomusa acidovorans]|uniref:YetF C-terminal domain-containing protein n=1 Tax=Sporomusa acidovorans (strain ATCC 49682 / DSM 3132 / Mol) TaxID=1123286 RepID=A0ABZ3IYQ0_SPOA4|nr:DUF421 domain-containing protein [Sporomusa acidovorans]OZC17687.1 hypothetical protein SPACI_36910 [Sporomusa acidovorans DSM 3132]SDE12078.1 Uncharacterized membrane protein YcaP, DUF421 family [Sporomusa acidovorans]
MVWQEYIRDTWQTTLVFLSLLVFTRILGNTQIGQLTFYEYISGITIGSIAGTVAGSDPDKVWNHYYDLVLMIALTYFFSFLTIKSRPLRKMIEGSSTVVIENGRILEENMRSMRYDLDELTGQLRQQGILDLDEVQYAIIETSGNLSIIKKSDYQPMTKSDFGIHLPPPAFPVELIMDGEIIEQNLHKKNLTKTWLEKQLSTRGISKVSQVTYASIDSKGQLFVSCKTSARNQNDN